MSLRPECFSTFLRVYWYVVLGGLFGTGWFIRRAWRNPESRHKIDTWLHHVPFLRDVLKGLAEYHDLSLGDLLEGIVLHAFDGKTPFGPESLRKIAALKKVYGLDLDAGASHRLIEREKAANKAAKARRKS